jgi:hypothetical protein
MQNKIKNILLLTLLVSLVVITGCASSSISEIKTESNIGKDVKVSGTVVSTIKLGSLSGYTIEDDTGKIAVSSQSLPKEGDTITVKGVLIKDSILGYYIKVD